MTGPSSLLREDGTPKSQLEIAEERLMLLEQQHPDPCPLDVFDHKQELRDRIDSIMNPLSKGWMFDGLMFQLQLKQFEREWAAEAKEKRK